MIKNDLWVALDKNGNKCYIGDTIKDRNGFMGNIVKVPSSTSVGFALKVEFNFGRVPIYDVFCDIFEKI